MFFQDFLGGRTLKTIPSANGSRLSTNSSSASPPRVIIWYISFNLPVMIPNLGGRKDEDEDENATVLQHFTLNLLTNPPVHEVVGKVMTCHYIFKITKKETN